MDKITEKKANKINGFFALFIVIGLFALDFLSPGAQMLEIKEISVVNFIKFCLDINSIGDLSARLL